MAKEYAMYHGDEFIAIGTTKELAKLLKVKTRTIQFYRTTAYQKRTSGKGFIFVDLGEEQLES